MASEGTLGRQIDFALNYQVEGEQAIGAVSDRLSKLNEAGTNVNEVTERARRLMRQQQEAMEATTQATQQLTVQQFDMATAVSESNEVVRDVTIGLELLRLEYDEGSISQDEYSAGLLDLQGRLDEVEVQTMSSVRAMRTISAEQRRMSAQVVGTTGNVRDNVFALNSMSRVMTALPGGINSVASRLPFLASNLARMSASGDQSLSVLTRLSSFLISPTGLVVALGAAIPLVISLAGRLRDMRAPTLDFEQLSRRTVSTLSDLIGRIHTLREMTDARGLNLHAAQENLAIWEAIREEVERDLRAQRFRLTELRQQAVATLSLNSNADRRRELSQDINRLEARLAEVKKEQESAELRIAAIKEFQASETGQMLRAEEQRLTTAKALAELEQIGLEEERRAVIDRLRWIDEVYDAEFQREQRRQQMRQQFWIDFQRGAPDDSVADDTQEIQRALSRQQLIEDARLAMLRDSITQQEFLRLQSEQDLQRQMVDLARQGILDQETLNAIRLMNQQALADQLLEIEDQSIDARMALWGQFASSIQGFGQVIYGQSEKNARRAFDLDKALALSSALAFGPQAVVRAYARGGFAEAIPTGLAVAAEIAKILASKFQHRGAAQGAPTERFQFAFRGVQADSPVIGGAAPTPVSLPDRIRLEDSGGRFLTHLQWAQDKDGASPYITAPSAPAGSTTTRVSGAIPTGRTI